jgi:predicted PurR-regulated permease PerM
MKQNGSKPIIDKFTESSKSIKTLTIVVSIFLILLCMKVAKTVMIPIAFAIFIMLILYPLLEKMDKLGLPSWFSNMLGLVLFLTFIVLLGWLLFIIIQTLIVGLPAYANKVTMIDKILTEKLADVLNLQQGETVLSGLQIDWLNFALSSLSNISSQFATIIKNILLITLFLFFLLSERRTIEPKIVESFSKSRAKMIVAITERTTKQISRYLLIKFLISTVTGVLFFLTAFVTGLDFAPLWGVAAFVLNFIPSIGSLMVTIATIVMAIIQFTPDAVSIIYVAVLAVSIQMVVGNIIDPKLQGIQLGLSPFILLISLSLWGFIWGIPGMFLAVPLTSILQILCINIPSLRPLAIMSGSGKSIQRQHKEETRLQKKLRRKVGLKRTDKLSPEDIEKQADERAKNTINLNDFILPDNLDLDD